MPISESAPHIYLSVLPFLPAESEISNHLQPHFPYTLTVLMGRATHWPAHSRRLDGHADVTSAVAVSKYGRYIVSAPRDMTICIWDAQTGDLVSGPFEGHTDRIIFVAFLQDDKHIMSASGDETTRIWNRDTGEAVSQPFKVKNTDVYLFALSNDGKLILPASEDHTSRVRSVESGQLVLGPFGGHTQTITAVVFFLGRALHRAHGIR